ncbi:MAG: hypothetical protein EBY24_18000 [Betaproteobacteria bacterium]|nr:hypothetical protein [Betaproteobacteria bacterium]
MFKKLILANFQINATALTASGADQAKLLYLNLGFASTKSRLNPAQAAAAPGPHDQHLTIDAEADLIQAPNLDCPPRRLLSRAHQRVQGDRDGSQEVSKLREFDVSLNRQDANPRQNTPLNPQNAGFWT